MIALAATLPAACGEYTPTQVREPGIVQGGGSAASIVGAWTRTLIIERPDDIITSETTWIFAADGTCERRVTTTTFSAGFSETQIEPCTYVLERSLLTIQFLSGGLPVTFTAVVSGGSLFLDGVEFQPA